MSRATNSLDIFYILLIYPHINMDAIDYFECSRCHQTKHRDNFWIRSDRPRGVSSACKECVASYYSNRYSNDEEYRKSQLERYKKYAFEKRQKIYDIILRYKQKPCQDCGISYPPCVMDFDHIDGTTKKSGLAKTGNFKNEEEVINEIAKCELVCANCHRMRTQKRKELLAQTKSTDNS
jgi:hypothetical protein